MLFLDRSWRNVLYVTVITPFIFLSVGTVDFDVKITTPEGENHLLNGYAAHDEFFNSLQKTIDYKVQVGSETILSYSKLDITQTLQNVRVSDYIFLQFLQSLNSSDLIFSKHLLEVNSYNDKQELPIEWIRSKKSNDSFLSEWLRENLFIPSDKMYSIVRSILKLEDSGSEIIPRRFVNEISSIMNKSAVFMYASLRGDIVVMNWLLNKSIDLNLTDALEKAWNQDRHDIVNLLLDNGAILNNSKSSKFLNYSSNARKNSLLHLAVESNSLKSVQSLVKAGISLNNCNINGLSPLYIAVKNDNAKITKLLLENGADANLETSTGNIALHSAAENGNKGIVNLLIERGSLIEKKNKYGITPLLVSEQYAVHGIISCIMEKNISTNDVIQELILFYDLNHMGDVISPESIAQKLNHVKNSDTIIRGIIDNSEIVKTLVNKGGKTYFGNNLKTKLLKMTIENGLESLSESLINLGGTIADV